ncbi:MAG: hypothetical protein V4724_37690 [Pseudomonadota bacterium]
MLSTDFKENKMIKRVYWGWWIVVVLSMALAAVVFGKYVGHYAADEINVRLALIWPDLINMPMDDRVIIVRASIACNANHEPMRSDAIAQCLRNGVKQMSHIDANAEKRLDELLLQAGK